MNRLAVVNLNDLYLTRTDAGREFRRLYRNFKKTKGSLLCICVSLGILYGLVYDLMKRMDALEKEKDETAG